MLIKTASRKLKKNVSVKISSLYSQLDAIDFGGSIEAVKTRLRPLFRKAKALGEALSSVKWVEKVLPIDTNILIFRTLPGTPGISLVKKLGSMGLLCMDFDKQSIRMVTHLDFTDQMLEESIHIIKTVNVD